MKGKKRAHASRTATMREMDIRTTAMGPILIPSLWSAKNLIRPAPAAGMGASPRFFFRVLGMAGTAGQLLICRLPQPFLRLSG